jgi:hypothetical protein
MEDLTESYVTVGTPFENFRGNYTVPLYLEFLGLSLCVR